MKFKIVKTDVKRGFGCRYIPMVRRFFIWFPLTPFAFADKGKLGRITLDEAKKQVMDFIMKKYEIKIEEEI